MIYPQPPEDLFRELAPTPEVEQRLVANFRRYHRQQRIGTWSAATLAVAASLALLVWRPTTTPVVPAPPDFEPLPGAVITRAMLDSAQIVRVELTPPALAQLGLATQAGPVQAELLLSPDGLARGIRFVQ